TMFSPLPEQVILLSDGEPNDNGFLVELAELVNLGIRVDTVGLNSSGNGRAVLQLIADETGGKLTLVN
ncbi:MAG: vWA domain-containing protein, partial [Verrucomicrobiota bacterium]